MTAATTIRKTRTARTMESLSGHLPAPDLTSILSSVVHESPASSVARMTAVMFPEEAGTPKRVPFRSLQTVQELLVIEARLYLKGLLV